MIAMSGQAAGLWLCLAFGVPALGLTVAGWRERKRDDAEADRFLKRDGL